MTAPGQEVVAVLDETIAALTGFDADRLEHLEERMAELASGTTVFEDATLRAIAERKRSLEILLSNCQANLNALKHLHVRNLHARNRSDQ